ncbi:DUF928 domain-containing protein [Pseudanabaena sp. UWO311]|uniref:DUF928 domain-containing protein n=1 Tax=Pseudanabaena sp. UWO311 TaxID=2487337 RepID=UPI0011599839|nr:DUF928 domain-containing protein [Pseudanabaena sp. UWO311]TYQ26964.1 DUF928 domain-containing protein [Pseudanabaena sp. UWO311]
MMCKVLIPQSNFLIAKTTKLSRHTYLDCTLTILICTSLSVTIPSYFLPLETISQTWLVAQFSGTNFGLGLPKTASTGGGTRLVNPDLEIDRAVPITPPRTLRGGASSAPIDRQPQLLREQQLPLLILITPEDGAKTAISQPTLYWHLHDKNAPASASEIDNLENNSSKVNAKNLFAGKLSLTTSEGDKSITIFQTDLKMSSGLSSFKIPIVASLQPSKTYRWQITVKDKRAKEVTASGWIVYTPPNDNLQKSLMRALTIRDRAKIYAEAGYWFEAIDGYTRWLNFKPEDLKARTAKNEILKSGFVTNKNLDFDSFIGLLNADTPKNKQVVIDK